MRPSRSTLDCVLAATMLATAATSARAEGSLSPEDAARLGTEAYVYGYPLVTMEMTRRVMTNVAAPSGKFAPMGRFAHLRAYPTPMDREVTAPNADTLYSLAWLDLSEGPYVFSIPDAKGRYYLMPMLSGWTDVFQAPGSRTTGTGAQTYAITGPGWEGTLPEGVTEYRSPTSLVWILGRIFCSGTPEDYEAVHAFQDGLSLVPLASYAEPDTPTPGPVDPEVDMKTPVRELVNRMGAKEYFELLATLLEDNPPAPADAPMVADLAKIGIVPGRSFDMEALPPEVAEAIGRAPDAGWKAIMANESEVGTRVNGWIFSLGTGTYGTDYLQRAYVTAIGLGANRPQDAIYPYTRVDGSGEPLSGANTYVLRFPKGQAPPVKGFWSLTMYDPEYFFVPNPIDRYSIGPRYGLATDDDGALTLYLQHESPGEGRESNWLPAPEGGFILMLRMYWPEVPIIDGSWEPPAVEKVQ